jgi:hypothetical protein
MKLTRAEALRLREKSEGAAHALLEDIPYIRGVVARQDTSRTEIRHLSVVLRRLLIDGDLARVAAPRIGRIKLHSLDNSMHTGEKVYKGRLRLFFCGDVNVFGQYIGTFDLHEVPQNQAPAELTVETVNKLLYPDGGEQLKDILLGMEQFLSQKVICFMGHWIQRRAVIKYMANLASGAHSDLPVHDEQFMLARVRNVVQVSKGPSGPHIHLVWETASPSDAALFRPAPPESVDPVLIELLATANSLTLSPDVGRLEEALQKEFA